MASTKVNIPTIDFCDPELKPNTPQWENTKIQVLEALQEHGYFEAIFDKVPNEIREVIFDSSKEAFEFPLVSKLSEYREKPYHIYEGQIPRLPLFDLVKSVDLLLPDSVETFVNTFWPDGNPNYCNVVKSYCKALMELDEMVKRMVLESLGLKNYIDEFLDPNFFMLRFTNYKDQGEHEHKQGLGSHTDGGYLTIIKQNQIGLQVLNKDGEWICVNTSPNSYLVLSADSFMAWTNGKLRSPPHKVHSEGDTDRFSIQLFSSPNPDYKVEVPKELVDEEHPLLFKPFKIHEYYQYIQSGFKNGVGLKNYCGL
ncbi:probable 2-oxoglutarate-dependent dioxygenase AOP1 [Solanum dulcamara]|uniref:probable 2-oxoglutarate-dependent dioxygenase AOP1 n=1 Tax=Solanum dulcamara TaxID=45834 RepID=UPI0024859390|nr:probable 2-oxoglutarate-dependent dioxygenase AOP1 [Solanum dulcamara]